MPPPLPADAAPIANPMTLKFAGIEAGVMKRGRAGEPVEQLSLSKRNLKDRLRRARQASSFSFEKEKPGRETRRNEEPIYLPRTRLGVASQEGRVGFIFEGPIVLLGVLASIAMCIFLYLVMTSLNA